MDVSYDQAYAYAEILEILSFTHISLTSKIPKKLLAIFEDNALSTYEHHLDRNIPLENQNISSETATLITLLSLNYWCTPEEKKELQQILIENENIQKTEFEEKYNIKNIFSNQTNNLSEISSSEEKSSEETYIESNLPIDTTLLPWYKKIIIKINEIISRIKK